MQAWLTSTLVSTADIQPSAVMAWEWVRVGNCQLPAPHELASGRPYPWDTEGSSLDAQNRSLKAHRQIGAHAGLFLLNRQDHASGGIGKGSHNEYNTENLWLHEFCLKMLVIFKRSPGSLWHIPSCANGEELIQVAQSCPGAGNRTKHQLPTALLRPLDTASSFRLTSKGQ